MKFFSSLALLVSAVAANPILRTRDTPKNFHLKTTGADNSAHNDLYVYGYHTGAGFNDAVLTSDVGTASPAFLNGTNVQFSLDTPFPWGLINTGYGSGSFSINDDSLEWSEQQGFGGWLGKFSSLVEPSIRCQELATNIPAIVCDWYHNAPQLFYLYKYREPTIPSSCSKVQLAVEPVS
ncbi:unnamed protein product [Aspergillus oryzae]|nr:unnamed protein product [Aspergillus oryzae]